MKFLLGYISTFFEYFIYLFLIVGVILLAFGLTKVVFPSRMDGNKIYGFSCYDGGRIILSSTGSSYDHAERSIIEDNSKLKLYLPSNCIVVEN